MLTSVPDHRHRTPTPSGHGVTVLIIILVFVVTMTVLGYAPVAALGIAACAASFARSPERARPLSES
jgi:hypothetical protein